VDNFQKFINKYLVYLEEIRRIIFSLAKIFVLAFFVGFFLTPRFIGFIIKYINLPEVKIVTTSPFQFIDLSMSFGFSLACVITVPFFIYYFYSFFRSGLLRKERRIFILSLPLSLLLFIIGFIYGIGILYYAIKLVALINNNLGIMNYWDISQFLSQLIVTSSLLGILFIIPLLVSALIRLNIISVEFLKSKRRHVFLGIFILVSLLPPTDGLSLILMAVPLILIFEFILFFNKKRS